VLDNDKLSFGPSATKELRLYSNYIDKFIDERCDPRDKEKIWQLVIEFPHVGLAVAKNYILTEEEKHETFLRAMSLPKLHTIGGGIKGGGKTALAYWIAEQLYITYGMKTCIFKPLDFNQSALPKYFSVAYDESEIPENTFVIYDETAITMNARRAMATEHVDFTAFLAIQRHRGNSMLTIQQLMALADKNIFRLSDDFIYKQLGMPQLESGEKNQDPFYMFIKFLKPIAVNDVLYFDSTMSTILFFKTPLASFWTDELSKPLASITDHEAIAYIVKEAEHRNMKELKKILWLKGKKWDQEMIDDILRQHNLTIKPKKKRGE